MLFLHVLLLLFRYCMNLKFDYLPLCFIFANLEALIFSLFSIIADFLVFKKKFPEPSSVLPWLKNND